MECDNIFTKFNKCIKENKNIKECTTLLNNLTVCLEDSVEKWSYKINKFKKT